MPMTYCHMFAALCILQLWHGAGSRNKNVGFCVSSWPKAKKRVTKTVTLKIQNGRSSSGLSPGMSSRVGAGASSNAGAGAGAA